MVTPAVLGFGLSSGMLLTLMAIVWGINGYFQSFGALSIVKVNAQWFHVRERGTFAGVFGVLIRFGLLLAFQGVPLIFLFFPWQYAFWIPAFCVAVFFLVNLKWMQNSPKDAGLGEFDTGDDADPTDVAPTIPEILRKVFASRAMWTIAAGSMMIGFVRRSVVDAWWPKYFVDEFLEPSTGSSTRCTRRTWPRRRSSATRPTSSPRGASRSPASPAGSRSASPRTARSAGAARR